MHWQEDIDPEQFEIPDNVIDLSFKIDCPILPVDYTWLLYNAISEHIPWINDIRGAGIMPLPILNEGNGWYRAENPDDLLNLSKRTRLTLRIPSKKREEVEALAGKTLQVGEYGMKLTRASVKPLSKETNIWSHYIVANPEEDEEQFLDNTIEQLRETNIHPRKAICGKTHEIKVPDDVLFTRSLMLADLEINESIKLQQNGLGEHGHLGCGLFIPHKSVSAI